jgi:hypothetical protein
MRRGPQEPPPWWLIILVGVGLIAAGVTIGYRTFLVLESGLAWGNDAGTCISIQPRIIPTASSADMAGPGLL